MAFKGSVPRSMLPDVRHGSSSSAESSFVWDANQDTADLPWITLRLQIWAHIGTNMAGSVNINNGFTDVKKKYQEIRKDRKWKCSESPVDVVLIYFSRISGPWTHLSSYGHWLVWNCVLFLFFLLITMTIFSFVCTWECGGSNLVFALDFHCEADCNFSPVGLQPTESAIASVLLCFMS